MPLWILTLWNNPLIRKLTIYAAVSLAICYAVRLWGNRQWAAGEQAGRIAGAAELESAQRAQYEAERRSIEAAGKEVAVQREDVQRQRAEIDRSRKQLQETLSRSLNEIAAHQRTNDARIDAMGDAELLAAIRVQSAKLASAH